MVALKLFCFGVVLCAIKVECGSVEITSYSRVSKNSDSISNQSQRGNEKAIKSLLNSSQPASSSSVKKAKPVEEEPAAVAEGRAIQSNYFPSMPNFMTKPVQRNNFQNEKGNRFIVYPSYNPNNIDQTRNRYDSYNSRFATGPLAQRRFSPSEAYAGTVYKIKQRQVENLKGPVSPPDALPPALTPPSSPPQYLPPQPQFSPPSKFYHPIVVEDITTATPKASTTSPKYFLPTIQSFIDKTATTPKSSLNNLSDFDKNVNTSYVPPVLHAIRDAMESNYINNKLERVKSSEDLQRFPPNTNSIYLPQETEGNVELVNSYLPAPSGLSKNKFHKDSRGLMNNDNLRVRNVTFEDLQKFPPNLNSAYATQSSKSSIELVNSYVPNPSGDPKFKNFVKKDSIGLPQRDLHRFPPNSDAQYFPSNVNEPVEFIDSYFSNPSGDPKAKNIIQKSPKNSIVAQNDLHRFQPNINSIYSQQNVKTPIEYVNSYFSNPSGDPKNHKIIVKENSDETTPLVIDLSVTELPEGQNEYLPPPAGVNFVTPNSNQMDESSVSTNDLHVFPPNIHSQYLPAEMMKHASLINSYIPPPSGAHDSQTINLEPPNQMSINQQPSVGNMHEPSYYYAKPSGGGLDMKEMPMGMSDMSLPPGPPTSPDMMPSGPPDDHDHDHDHHHHHHDHNPWDYSDLIFDDPHHHHHHFVEETTAPPPPPPLPEPAPEEPRVKKYSYYYLGRKLWYIPLYFTFWFCLYVAALIIRSIGRHKVDLPNHYSRSLHDLSHPELVAKINKMTEFTMSQIEDFKEKYL